MATYVDASALTKVILDEAESQAVRRWYVESDRILSSRIGLIETRRALMRRQHDPAHAEFTLRSVEVVELDASIAREAGSLGPATLRALDAIHIASALQLGSEIDAFVTYDDRQAAAARAIGLHVVRPA